MIPLKLIQVEWFKVRRRFAFWASMLGYFGLLVFGFFMMYREQVRRPEAQHFSLPGDWVEITQMAASIGGFVVTIAIVLLTASEKTWRTERQNVIDGLSRNQYFLGKLMLFVAVSLLLWVGTIGITSGFGAAFRGRAPTDAPLIDVLSLQLLGGLLVRFIFLGAVAFCFALIASGSGAALAFAVLFIILQAPVFELFVARGGLWADIARYLPDRVMDNLTNITIYDPDRLQTMNERAREVAARVGSESARARELLSPARALSAAGIYIALFTTGGWWSIRRRDL